MRFGNVFSTGSFQLVLGVRRAKCLLNSTLCLLPGCESPLPFLAGTGFAFSLAQHVAGMVLAVRIVSLSLSGVERIVTMHARQLIDMAVWVATHRQGLLVPRTQIPLPAIERYWSSSKCRLDRWGWALKEMREAIPGPFDQAEEFRALLVEILASDVLTRVWSGLLCAHDQMRGTSEVEPIARSVYIGHLEARHRALTFLLDHSASDLRWAVEVDRVRRQTERWTDLLLALMSELPGCVEFAVDHERIVEFGLGCGQRSTTAESLVAAGVRTASRRLDQEVSPNADLNSAVAASVLGCFPSAAFDGVGVPRPHGYWSLLEGSSDKVLVTEKATKRRLATADRMEPGRVFWPGSDATG